MNSKKAELLALADEKPTSINDDLYAWATQASAALREYAATMEQPKIICPGRPDSRCNYDATCGQVCNKCGRVHNGYANTLGTTTSRGHAATMEQEPVAWLYTCQKPGTQTVYASVDENDSYHWPIDQWRSIAKTPLFAHPPALTTQKVCHGIPRIGCNYLAECDSICNKCGQLHAVQFIPQAPTTPPAPAW